MSHNNQPRDWDRPQGVSQGNWQYINDASIAAGYDASLEDSPLVLLDQQIIQKHFPEAKSGVVLDFGCGTGRNAIPLLDRGWQVVGIDLSAPMLKQMAAKLPKGAEAMLVQANLLELDCLGTDVGDFGQCMFSTFGMLQGKAARQKFLQHVRRVLKPSATFVVHAHNYWHHLRIPGGIKWMVLNTFQAFRGRCEMGDRFADYRTVNQLMLHHFSLRSFRSEILQSGMKIGWTYAILPDGHFSGSKSTFGMGRPIGWVLVCNVN